MTYEEIVNRARELALYPMGAFHVDGQEEGLPEGTNTVVLLGPDEPGVFWEIFVRGTEYLDEEPDPLDRWSRRTVGTLAHVLPEADAVFPFDGPPYLPFTEWALETGHIWTSPVGLLVHDGAGLWVSFRGALALKTRLTLPEPGEKPCDTCEGQPCRTACPVGALTPEGYDVPRCKAYVASDEGEHCRVQGCAVRRACPVSQGWERDEAQAHFHMRAFLG